MWYRNLAVVVVVVTALSSASAATVVRDQVTLKLGGQTRHLKLCSDDARVVTEEVWGGNMTGTLLVGSFYLKLVKPNGAMCGSPALGKLSIDQGDGRDRYRVLLLGDYDGNGSAREVALKMEYETMNSQSWGVVEAKPGTGKLVQWLFARGKEVSGRVSAINSAGALRYKGGFFRARGYDNTFELSEQGYYEDLFRWDAAGQVWRFVKTVATGKPEGREWPRV